MTQTLHTCRQVHPVTGYGTGADLSWGPGGCRGPGQSSRKPEEMYREKACVPGKETSGLTAEPRAAPGCPDPEL